MKIQNQKHGNLSEADRLELAGLLAKAGYLVRIGKEKLPGKPTAKFIHYVEFWGDERMVQG